MRYCLLIRMFCACFGFSLAILKLVMKNRKRGFTLCEERSIEGLLSDLIHLNPGRPTGRYDVFFQHMTGVVEEVTAANKRRHGEAHVSEWLSLKDLMRS